MALDRRADAAEVLGVDAMNAKSQSVVLASPMKATEPNSTPSMSRTRWPTAETQCAAVPRYDLPPPV